MAFKIDPQFFTKMQVESLTKEFPTKSHPQRLDFQLVLIGSGLILFNIILMSFIGFYFLNSEFHTLMTGKPF